MMKSAMQRMVDRDRQKFVRMSIAKMLYEAPENYYKDGELKPAEAKKHWRRVFSAQWMQLCPHSASVLIGGTK